VRLTQVRRIGVYPVTGDQTELREGPGRQPASQGVGPGDAVRQKSVFEVQRTEPSFGEETAAKGREARGAAERGHGQDASFKNGPGRARGWS